jgi:integrase
MDAPSHGEIIAALKPGESVRLQKIDGGGSLEARCLLSRKVQFYWRFTQDGRTQREPIGLYDSSVVPKTLTKTEDGRYSVKAAIKEAERLAERNSTTPGGLRAEREREDAAKEAAKHAAASRERFTLKALCIEYCEWLKKREKPSHKDARNIFDNHLFTQDVATMPAALVPKIKLVEAVRRLTDAGHRTTARKLRAYLRAAYACAVRADSDPDLPAAFIGFGVTVNPVEGIAPMKGGTDKNPLSGPELRAYWKELKSEPGLIGAALRLQVVTGGQRIAQLVRLRAEDVQEDELQLLDTKGKRAEPRPHLLPITPAVQAELEKLSPKGFVLSTDGGDTPMHPTSLTAWAAVVATRAGIKDFQLKRVRSGIETALAKAGIPLHVRGQLQSHGLGGVQERHYDAHSYMAEKRAALLALVDYLNPKPRKGSGVVVPIKRKKRA